MALKRRIKAVHSYALDDELLLFNEHQQQLVRCNATAAAIWKGLAAALSPEQIASDISATTRMPPSTILADIHRLLDHWEAIGLWQNVNTLHRPVLGNTKAKTGTDQPPTIKIPIRPAAGTTLLVYQILETVFELSVPSSDIAALIKPLIDHLKPDDSSDKSVQFNLIHAENRYLLLKDGEMLDSCRQNSGIAPMIHGHSAIVAYRYAAGLFGLHAAMVSFRKAGILMPAVAGSGKSTLTAAMLRHGFLYAADDTVILTKGRGDIQALPMAIAIKKGAWKVLEPYYPDIAGLPIHTRVDGKQIRFIAPPAECCLGNNSRLRIGTMIFPRYDPKCRHTELSPISSADSLVRLTEAGYDTRNRLTPESVGQLVSWVKSIPGYTLVHSHLENAIESIKSLVE